MCCALVGLSPFFYWMVNVQESMGHVEISPLEFLLSHLKKKSKTKKVAKHLRLHFKGFLKKIFYFLNSVVIIRYFILKSKLSQASSDYPTRHLSL